MFSVDGAPAGTGPAASANQDQELRDTKKKLSATMEVQAQLEMDVVELANQVSVLQGQLKDLRKSKHGLEEALSQEQMTYINEKQQWLDKEAESEATIVKLKEELAGNKSKKEPEQQQQQHAPAPSAAASMMGAFSFPKFGRAKDMSIETAQQHPESSPTTSTFARGHNRLLSIGSLKEAVASPSNSTTATTASTKEKDKTIERLKNELEQVQQQTEIVSREYSLRHEQIELELTQTKAMVSRLMEENEGFQFLLAEKAILGGFAASNDINDSTTNTTNDNTTNDDTKDDEDDDAATAIEHASPSPQPQPTPADLKKRVYELEFETKSVRNHNKALTLSLERLVQRLLEYKDFERVVETQGMSGNINPKTISSFQARMGSTAGQGLSFTGVGVGGGPRSTNLVGRHPGDRSSVMSDMGYFGVGAGIGGSTLPSGERKGHGRNRGSMSSLLSLPPNAAGGRSRPIKNPATWNNLLLGGQTTPEGLEEATMTSTSAAASTIGSTTIVDRNSSIVSSSNASSVSPLASPVPFRPDSPAVSSVSSLEEHQQQHSLAAALVGAADELMRRPSTSGQKKLRPLTMGV